MLRITAEVRDELLAHAVAGLPNEACGMFSARDHSQLVDAFHPMSNPAASPVRFMLDPREMLDVERGAESAGRTVLGVMHSHPDTTPYPSPTDVADATGYDPAGTLFHVIVSLRHDEAEMRCFHVAEGEITEQRIVISGSEPMLNDGEGAVAAVAQLRPPREPR